MSIKKSDWSNFDQSDDYSFDASYSSFADYSGITVYLNGTQVWGEGPIDGTPTPSPVPTNTPTPYAGTDSEFQQRFLDLWNDLHVKHRTMDMNLHPRHIVIISGWRLCTAG